MSVNNVITDFCADIVLKFLNDQRSDGHDKGFTTFWRRIEDLFPLSNRETKEEWVSDVHHIKSSYIYVDSQFFKLLLERIDEAWKWPLIISLNIEICKKHVNDILIEATDIGSKWKNFLRTILFLFNLLYKLSSIHHITLTSTVQLCLKQIKNIISLFHVSIDKRSTVIKKYATHCLTSCLTQLQEEIIEKNEISCNEFIDLMDSAISHLDNLVGDNFHDLDNKNSSLKNLVDELLCHAMTTAHVTSNKHSKDEILSKSQVILREMESLKDALTEQENATIKLTAESLCNALCSLERLVNSAVLKLVLHVGIFGDTPIKNLIKICQPRLDTTEVNRKAGDLDELIISFDSYLDMLMQIGSFAISCSSSVKKAVELKSCLASFESMEAELVPCVTTMYLNPVDSHKRDLRLFLNYWLDESTKFSHVLDTIIDPTAYTEIVKSFLAESIKDLKEDNRHTTLKGLKKMVKAVRTLKGVVQVSIQLQTFGNSPEFAEKYDQVCLAVVKCEKLCSNIEYKESSLEWKKYLKKYSQNLLDSVDSLLCYQTSKLIESQLSNDTTVAVPMDYYKLCVSDIETTENTNYLAHHIAEGERLARKSVLYNTPKRTTRITSQTPVLKSVLKGIHGSSIARNRHRFSIKREQIKKDLSDMELTMLLEDIKGIDGTFFVDDTFLPGKDFQGRNLLDLFADWTNLMDASNISITCTSSDPTDSTPDSNHVNTLERMCDLLAVQEKIDNIRTGS